MRPGTERLVCVPRSTADGTDYTHQSGSSVNQPAGRSEWSDNVRFTRLHPAASNELPKIGKDAP